MTTEEQQIKQEGIAVKSFREKLVSGDFDGAKIIELEQGLPPQAISSIVHAVYENLFSEERFVEAIDLGNKYNLSKDTINDTIYSEFRRIINSGDIDLAIAWAMKNNLPDYEISRAAIKGIETAILNQKISLAIEIKQKYSISDEQIGNSWQTGYDIAFQSGNFFDAALLSREFGMSERKTVITSAKAFRKAMKNNDFETMGNIEKEFHIFNDTSFSLVGDEDGRKLIKQTEEFLKIKLKGDTLQQAVLLIEELGFLFKKITNHTLRDIVHFVFTYSTQVHLSLLNEDKYADALWLKNELNLLEESTPDKTLKEIFSQGLNYHNSTLKKKQFSRAIEIKNDYDLHGDLSDRESLEMMQEAVYSVLTDLIEKGETKAANQIIKEYNTPQEDIEKVANEVVIKSLKEGEHDRALDIVTKFHIDIKDFDIKAAATEAFELTFNNGYFETAADLGYIFEIGSPKLKQAASTVWQDLMLRQEYKKAVVLKRKHKLTKKHTEKVAKTEYDRLLGTNDLDKARLLRDEYRINISFIAWIIELIKRLFSVFFGGDTEKVEKENGQEGNTEKNGQDNATNSVPQETTSS